MRDELLNGEEFDSLLECRIAIERCSPGQPRVRPDVDERVPPRRRCLASVSVCPIVG